MIDEQINEQLGLLQKELSRLKSVTDYIDDSKTKSDEIIGELEKIQKNYGTYTHKIQELHKDYAEKVKDGAVNNLNQAAENLKDTGNKIDATNKAKLDQINKLLIQYAEITETSDKLIKAIEEVDFPQRLENIKNGIKTSNNNLKELKKKQEDFEEQISIQDKKIKLSHTLHIVTILLIVISFVISLFK